MLIKKKTKSNRNIPSQILLNMQHIVFRRLEVTLIFYKFSDVTLSFLGGQISSRLWSIAISEVSSSILIQFLQFPLQQRFKHPRGCMRSYCPIVLGAGDSAALAVMPLIPGNLITEASLCLSL